MRNPGWTVNALLTCARQWFAQQASMQSEIRICPCLRYYYENIPVESMDDYYHPGTRLVTVGTPYRSSGNTGTYTVRVSDSGRG